MFGIAATDAHVSKEERAVTPAQINASSAQFAHLNLGQSVPPTFALTESRANFEIDNEVASVSTETEDDPVSMAMRATLGEDSSMGEEDPMNGEDVEEEDEEQMVWSGR